MPNLKRPEGLYIRRGRWNKLCVECKRNIVRENITKELELVLCNNCVDVFTGKCIKRKIGCRFYKIMSICNRCKKRFESKIDGRVYCYECKPERNGDKNETIFLQDKEKL